MFEQHLIIFLAAFIVMLASLGGVFFLWKSAGGWLTKHLRYLISFAAGVFLLVAIHLFIETIEFTGSAWVTIVAALAGIVLAYGADKLLPEGHHHHKQTDDCDDCERHDARLAWKVIGGDALHNVADGVLLVPAFIIDLRLGLVTLVGIFVHEFIQEISEFVILKEAGYKTGRALLINFLVSATILIGIAIGLALASSQQLVGPLLGLSAGVFLFVVIHDLVPRSLGHKHGKRDIAKAVALGIVGILLMVGINALGGHNHVHEDDHDHNHGAEHADEHKHDEEHAGHDHEAHDEDDYDH